MELRHLRYFLAVAEALNFTKAATQLRVAQPALSRQVQDLEDELGVDLLKRSPRGVTLTAEGKLFLEETRDLLKRSEQAVQKVRALARGEYGELHVGYAPSPSVEILPPALAAFQKVAPGVRVVLHDLGSDEMLDALRDGKLELALTVGSTDGAMRGIEFEELRRYSVLVAMAAGHPLEKKKALTVREVAGHSLIGLQRHEYTEYYRLLDRVFATAGVRPKIAVECDGSTSMIAEIAVGSSVAVVSELFRHVAGQRLVYRPLSDSQETHSVGVAWATKGDLTPAGEKFRDSLRQVAAPPVATAKVARKK